MLLFSFFCVYTLCFFVFFFFQAEDGIRDGRVTGVQTCALPIFREDLYYRLNVVEVTPPPLRERTGDLPLLCELFLAEKAAELGVPKKRLSPAAFEALSAYSFPGNVRELENLIERATVFADGDEILPADLPLPSTRRPLQAPSLDALASYIIGPDVQDGWS